MKMSQLSRLIKYMHELHQKNVAVKLPGQYVIAYVLFPAEHIE